jgi:hypothetical protein
VQFYAFRKPDKFVRKTSNGSFEVKSFSGPHGSTAAYGLRMSGAGKLLAQPKVKVAADKWAWLTFMTGIACCAIAPFPVGLHETLSVTSTISSGRSKSIFWRVLVLPVLRGILIIRGL